MTNNFEMFDVEKLTSIVQNTYQEMIERMVFSKKFDYEIYFEYAKKNKKAYEIIKNRFERTNERILFLIKPKDKKLYKYIKKDIKKNKLEHRVVLLPKIKRRNY